MVLSSARPRPPDVPGDKPATIDQGATSSVTASDPPKRSVEEMLETLLAMMQQMEPPVAEPATRDRQPNRHTVLGSYPPPIDHTTPPPRQNASPSPYNPYSTLPPHMTSHVAISPYHQQYHIGYTQRQYQSFPSEGEIRTDYAVRDHPANPHPVLQQISTVAVYIQEFEDLSIRNRDLSADNLWNLFMAGLKEEIRTEIILFRPQTLSAAMGIARAAEQRLITTKGGIPLPSADFDYYQHWSPYAPSARDRYTYQYTPLGYTTLRSSATSQPPSMATPTRNHHPSTGNYYQRLDQLAHGKEPAQVPSPGARAVQQTKPSSDETVMLSNKVIDTVFWNSGDLKVVDEVTETKREEEEGEKESGELEETVRREEEPTTVVLVETVVDEDGAKIGAQPPTVTASQCRASAADWTLNYRSKPKLLGFHSVNQSEMATATTDTVRPPPSCLDSNAAKGDKNHLGKRSIDLCRKRLVFEFDPIFGEMDFHGLTRRHLQALCKLNKIPATMTNVAMTDALSARLTPNAIAAINGSDVNSRPLLQVIDMKLTGNAQERYQLLLSNSRYYKVSDSVSTQHAMLAAQLNDRVKSGQVVRGSVVQLIDYRCSPVQNRKIIVLLNVGTIIPECDIIGDPKFFLECDAISQKVLPNQMGEQSVRVTGTRINDQKSGVHKQSFHPVVQPPYQLPPNYKSRGPVFINEALARIIPVSALNPYQVRWAIKARVTIKGDLRRYNNAKGDGEVFSFNPPDSDGGEIRMPCFNTVVDRFYDVIEVGKVYVIWKGSLKRAQKNFNHLKNEWEIILDTTSTVDLCPDEEESIPRQQFTFAPITEIESAENNAIIDIIGIIVTINPSVPILRKNGMETQGMTINLKDTSGKAVELTLWGDFCNREGLQLQEMLDSGSSPVLTVNAGKVSDFSGKSVGIISASQFFLNPDFPAVHALRQWVDQGGKNSASLSISKDGTPGGSRNDTRKAISNIKLVLKPEQCDEMVTPNRYRNLVATLLGMASKIAAKHLEKIPQKFEFSANNIEPLVQTCMTTFSSKIGNRCKRSSAEIGAKAILAVADLERKDINMDLIEEEGKVGGKLEDTKLVYGIVVDRDVSHPQMPKVIEDAHIAILTCPVEPPKPKTKHKVDIDTTENFNTLRLQEQKYLDEMVQKCKDVGAVVGTSELVLFPYVMDICGLNIVSQSVLSNDGAAFAGISCSITVETATDKHPRIDRYAIRFRYEINAALQAARDGVMQELQTKYPELNLEVEVVSDGGSIDTKAESRAPRQTPQARQATDTEAERAQMTEQGKLAGTARQRIPSSRYPPSTLAT